MAEFDAFVNIILFPIVTLLLWTLLFNSKNSRFTKFFVEGGYLIIVIPIMVLTFLTIPFMMVAFWLNTSEYPKQIVQLFLAVTVAVVIVVEYYYIKRVIKQIEEREQMSIIQVFKRELDPEYRKQRKLDQKKRADESEGYFDEISRMNEERRKIDLEKKEKLKRALLNEYE